MVLNGLVSQSPEYTADKGIGSSLISLIIPWEDNLLLPAKTPQWRWNP